MGNVNQRYVEIIARESNGTDLFTAIDYITHLESTHKSMRNELQELRQRDIERQGQLEKLGQQISRFQQQQQQNQGTYEGPPGPVFGGHFPQNAPEPPRTLPPLMNGTGPSAMQGIQYSDDRR